LGMPLPKLNTEQERYLQEEFKQAEVGFQTLLGRLWPSKSARARRGAYADLLDAWHHASPDDRRRFLYFIDAAFVEEQASTESTPSADSTSETKRRTKLERELDAGAFHQLRAAQIKIAELENENAELRRQVKIFRSPVRCEFVEDDGGRAAAGYGESEGDCVARAIAIAASKPYGEVFEALKGRHTRYTKSLHPGSYAAGHEERRRTEPIHNGCDRKVYGPYLRSLGWQYTRLRERTFLRAGALPPGRLIVQVNHHLVALIDDAIHDTWDSGGAGKRLVEGYWSHPVTRSFK
jgi:hypothetical protein